MSKLASAAITVTVTQTPISWRRLGRVIEKNSRNGPGAVDPGGLVQRWVDLAHPGEQQQRAQTEQHPRADDADRGQGGAKSPSQARVTPPRPTAERNWLTSPVDDSSQLHMMPAATSGMTCGRKSTVRATTASRLVAISRIVAAITSPSATGMKLKKTISSKALGSSRTVGVGEDLGVVVEPDPGGRPMPFQS